MELYNLDKKSDSTRGRKSLDVKHELTSLPAAGGAGAGGLVAPPRQDKINSLLLQATAAAAVGGGKNGGGAKSPYGAMLPGTGSHSSMSSYMNALSTLYGSLQPQPPSAHLSSLMTSPLLNGGLMPHAGAAGRFFPLPGMSAGGMLPSLPASLALFSPTAATNLATSSPSPLKMTSQLLQNSVGGGGLITSSRSAAYSPDRQLAASPEQDAALALVTGASQQQRDVTADDVTEETRAEDLSIKTAQNPPHKRPYHHGHSDNEAHATINCHDLVISSSESGDHVTTTTSAAITAAAILNQTSNNNESQQYRRHFENISPPTPYIDIKPQQQTRTTTTATTEETIVSTSSQHDDGRSSPSSPATTSKSRSSSIDDVDCDSCDDAMTSCERCPHAHQLKRLRRSVLQMLRCFMLGGSSDKTCVNAESADVDNLLYDVMFTAMEEVTAAANNNKKKG